MSNGISVVKRTGESEPLNLEKVHKVVEDACKGLAGVSASAVEMNSGLQFYDGIETDDIQEILVRSANDLITLDNPNYQFVAARLLLFGTRKQAFHKDIWTKGMPHLETMRAVYAERREAIAAGLERIAGVRCPLPEGTFLRLRRISRILGR